MRFSISFGEDVTGGRGEGMVHEFCPEPVLASSRESLLQRRYLQNVEGVASSCNVKRVAPIKQ